LPNHLRKEPKELPKPHLYKTNTALNTNASVTPTDASIPQANSNRDATLNRPSLTTATTHLNNTSNSHQPPQPQPVNREMTTNMNRPFSGRETPSGQPALKATFQTTRTMRPSAGESSGEATSQARTRAVLPVGMSSDLFVGLLLLLFHCIFFLFSSLVFFIGGFMFVVFSSEFPIIACSFIHT
jgi:hypothetical protein